MEPMLIFLILVALVGFVIIVIAAPGVIRQRRRDLFMRRLERELGVNMAALVTGLGAFVVASQQLAIACAIAAAQIRAFGDAFEAANRVNEAYDRAQDEIRAFTEENQS